MKINSYFYTPNAVDLDIVSRMKKCIYHASEKFIRFCTDFLGPYLGNDALQPHLQNINQLCISETDSSLEVHQQNIYTILQKAPSLLEFYMAITQNLKEIQPDLFKLDQKIADDQDLLKMHFQVMQNITQLETPMPFLEIYLRSLKKIKNDSNHTLAKHICGLFTSHLILEKKPKLQEFFFLTIHTIWDLELDLADVYLENMSIICNFNTLLLDRYFFANSVICHLEPVALKVHLNNMNSLKLPFLEDYVNTLCDIKNEAELLKLYIYTVSINLLDLLETHQENIQNICRQPLSILEVYLKIILELKNNEHLLKQYILSLKKIDYTKNIPCLELHLKNIDRIHDFHPKLLELYLQNIYSLNSLQHYIQTVHAAESYQDQACIIYCEHNITYISQSQPELLNLYFAASQALEDNQRNPFFYSYSIYFISQNYPEELKKYFKVLLLLKKSAPLPLSIKNTPSKPDFLVEFISKILSIELTEEVPSSFYISSIYITYLMTQKHSELLDLYDTSYKILESKQEDVLCHLCNVFYLSQKYPQLLQNYLEIVLFLTNTHSNLLWPHLKNIQNNYDSDPSFYIFKISDIKNYPELLAFHICHTFNIHRIKNQHPLLLEVYKSLVKVLENNPKSTSCYVYSTYHISILLTESLKKYLETVQKAIHMPQDDPKWTWLNDHLHSIQEFTFEDSTELQKHLQLIFQVDTIFEGKMFLMEEIVKSMQEEEKKAFISTSPAIMPYVVAKTIFLYVFHDKYKQLDPGFFSSEIKQAIEDLRKEAPKCPVSKLQKIFMDFNHYQSEELPTDNIRSVLKKIQILWVDAIQGENNLFMQCWKEAAKTVDLI